MVAEPVLGAVPTDGLLGPPGSPGLAVEVLVPRLLRSIPSLPIAPLVPGIEEGLLAVLLPVPAVPGEAVAPDPEVALPVVPTPRPPAPVPIVPPVLPFAPPPAAPPELAPPDAPPALLPPELPPLCAYAALATPNRTSAERVAARVMIFMVDFLPFWL